jgi:hypothetical protein
MRAADIIGRPGARLDEQGLLFEYTVKLLLVMGLLELILFRLVSRLGMHFSKLAEQHDGVRVFFRVLSSTGFALLNIVSILVFLALLVVLVAKFGERFSGQRAADLLLSCSTALLLLLTVGFLIVPPGMLGAILYNGVVIVVLSCLTVEYLRTHRRWSQRAMMSAFSLGLSGWLYFQTMSTLYGLAGWVGSAPFVHEVSRIGEALMVLASILVFFAYAGSTFWSRNRTQRRRALMFSLTCGIFFVGLLFLDYFLTLYDPKVADGVRKATQGIGWIFQMGMGYTFFLPFALYVAGLLCWAYTVLKQVGEGRPAGYGLGLMFIAGYALQLSHLTLLVVLGMTLVNLDAKRRSVTAASPVTEAALSGNSAGLVSERT